MNRLLLSIATALLVATSPVLANGLDDGEVVDRVYVHQQKGQALLVMSVDLPLSVEANEHKLSHKLSTYVGFVESGQLRKKYTEVRADVPVVLSFVFDERPPATVLPKLRAMRERLISRGYEVEMKVVDAKLKKLVELEP